MVKHPQSALGYFVDGKVMFPARDASSRCKGQTLTSTKKKKGKNRNNGQARDHNPMSSREICNKAKLSTRGLEGLKNASKQGKYVSAHSMSRPSPFESYGPRRSPDQNMFFLAQCLVLHDIENRSAVYYAAHAGHAHLVKTYLALIVLVRSMRRARSRALAVDHNKAMSIRDWLNCFGYPHFFGPKDFDLCVLNALNATVKALFKHEKYSLGDIRDIVVRSPWGEYVPQLQVKKKKKRKPALIMDDEYSVSTANDLDGVDEFWYDDNAAELSSYQEPEDVNDKGNLQALVLSDEDEMIMQLYGMMLLDDERAIDATHHVGSPFEEEEQVDYERVQLPPLLLGQDDWSEVESSASSSFVQFEGDGCSYQNEDDWSILSEISSVKSINSSSSAGIMSYSDTLLQGNGTNTTAGTSGQQSKARAAPGLQTVQEDVAETTDQIKGNSAQQGVDQSDKYDAFFFREGAKGCRGGKNKLMFTGNQKTPRYGRSKYRRS